MSVHLALGTGLALGRLRPPPPVAPGAPKLVRPPALVGAGRIGAPLAIDPGAWTGAVRFEFAWLRNGASITGAGGPEYVPRAADDHAALAARVSAFGAGRTDAETPAITIVFPQPLLVGPIPDLHYTQGTGPHIVDISPFFSGSSLEFSVSGDGVAVDPATGLLTVDVAALLSGVSVLVTATNSGGMASSRLRLTVTSAPVAIPPVMTAAPTLVGGGRVGVTIAVEPGLWAGDPAPELALQWLANGAPVAGATGPSFVPGAAEDGAAVACRVVAANAAGTAEAETAAIVVTRVPPEAVGVFADVALALGGVALTLAAAAGAFAGDALVFAGEGGGAEVDAATGVVTIPAATRRAAEAVTITATNSGGAASLGFAVTVLAAPSALAAPAPVALAQGAGTRTVATAGFFAGDALVFGLDAAPAGVTIDAGSGLVTVPTAAPLEVTVAVRATNAVGAATQAFALRVAPALTAPSALRTPGAAIFAQGPGARTVSAQAFFAGDDLVYALDAAPAGVTIDAGSGLVTIPTAATLEATVAVRATNVAGAATQSFALSVVATATVFDAAAKLATVSFLHRTQAPSWTHDAAQGCAVLSPGRPSDFTHGAWTLGRGDGLYRALVRIGHSAAAYARSRPLGVNGRMARDAAGNWRGIRVELDRRVDGSTAFEIREYAGRAEAMTLLGGGAAPWSYDVWSWLEVEFDGAIVRGRVYAETAAAPAWQATATAGYLGAGFFGPMSHTFAGGTYPIISIRTLEYHPAAAPAPAQPAAEHWTLEQITVRT